MRTDELTLPGFRHDVCSAIHPLGRSSVVLRGARARRGVARVAGVRGASVRRRRGGAPRARRRRDGGFARGGRRRVPAARRAARARAGARSSRSLLGPFPLDPRAPLRLAARARRRRRRFARCATRCRAPTRLRGARSRPNAARAFFAGNARALDAAARAAAERGVRAHAADARPCGGLAVSARRLAGARRRARGVPARERRRDPRVVDRRRAAACGRRSVRRLAAGAAATRPVPGALRARAAPLPPRPGSVQARLGARRPDPVARRALRAGGDGASRRHVRGDRGIRARAVRGPRVRAAVRAAGAAEPLGRLARAGGAAHGVGVLPRAERRRRRH